MKIEVYIPSNQQTGETIAAQIRVKALEETQRLLCHLFGGTTTIPGVGNWLDSESRLHVEPVAIVTSYGDCGPMEREAILNHCHHLADILNQSCVMFVCGDSPTFIENNSQELAKVAA